MVRSLTVALAGQATSWLRGNTYMQLLWKLVAYGLATQLVGLLVAALTWQDGRRGSRDGNELGWWVAVGLFEIGGLLLLVAVIAFGVRLGLRPPDEPRRREASEEERALLARRAR